MKARVCGCHSHGGFQLSPEGLVQRDGPELAGAVAMRYLDKVGSVSALVEGEDLYANVTDHILEAQSERFHHGS